MKTKVAITSFTILILAFIFSKCDDNIVNDNNNNGGCTKIPSLTFPPADTTYSASSVDFRWTQPTCIPSYYKLIVFRTGFADTVTTQFNLASIILDNNYRYYWKVRAYYGTPVNDSAESVTNDFFLLP